jgi:hypothetical protein
LDGTTGAEQGLQAELGRVVDLYFGERRRTDGRFSRRDVGDVVRSQQPLDVGFGRFSSLLAFEFRIKIHPQEKTEGWCVPESNNFFFYFSRTFCFKKEQRLLDARLLHPPWA